MKLKTPLLIFIGFILLHLVFLNINAAEWGDSYRILRASEYIRDFSYPKDEKRPPLFSFLLAIRPEMDPILWGRIFMLGISALSFVVFKKLVDLMILEERYRNLALVVFVLNPVFLYWSIRVYADVPFTLLALLSFYMLKKWEKSYTFVKFLAIGVIAGLGILTRFEGYLLVGSIGLSFLLRKEFIQGAKNAAKYALGVGIVALPYLVYRNPFTSSYFEEPARRVYDLTMVSTYLASLLFVFGFTSAFFFILNNFRGREGCGILPWGRGHIGITIFVVLELLLALWWPAAVPRLFVPVIPLLIIVLVQSVAVYFETPEKRSLTPLLQITTLLGAYVVGQYVLKLQFLVLYKWVFLAVVALQLVTIFSIHFRKYKLFVVAITISMFIWSISTIWLHRNNLVSIKHAAEYAGSNLTGLVAYNDVSSVSDWYLNQNPGRNEVKGEYYLYLKKGDLAHDVLLKRGFDYLILTNEHNTDMTLDLESRPYLVLVKDFNYEVGGKAFFAKILSVTK